jgi:hypothetical protein
MKCKCCNHCKEKIIYKNDRRKQDIGNDRRRVDRIEYVPSYGLMKGQLERRRNVED